jgi:hypothetical protein
LSTPPGLSSKQLPLGFVVTGLTSNRGRIVCSQSIDALLRAYRRHSGHDRHGLASTTPLGPLTQRAFFAAPTLNRSLVVGSPPPARLSQTDAWSFSSTSWVTMCHRVDPETGPFSLTRLAVISSLLISKRTARRHTYANAVRRSAISPGVAGEICLFSQELHGGRNHWASTAS